MNRMGETLMRGGGFIGFIVAGDPDLEGSFKAACAVIEAGADVLELGLPFSDPLADGPRIQAAGVRALDSGMNTDKYFKLAERLTKKFDIPLVCLTYYNIPLQYGLSRFASKCRQSGIEGVIIPDLPFEECRMFRDALIWEGVNLVFLIAQTTPDDRLEKILEYAGGFAYIVSVLGTTGERNRLSPMLKGLVKRVKRLSRLPVAVGFGISRPEDARQVISYGADAVIVGSALVGHIEKGDLRGLSSYVHSMKAACMKEKRARI
jgi:tryptophan synthase alpha chain